MFPVIFKRENLVYGSLYATNKIEDLSKREIMVRQFEKMRCKTLCEYILNIDIMLAFNLFIYKYIGLYFP